MTAITDPDLPGWHFSLSEVSNGVWRADGQHTDGRSVSRMGTDETQVLKDCMEDARQLPARRQP